MKGMAGRKILFQVINGIPIPLRVIICFPLFGSLII